MTGTSRWCLEALYDRLTFLCLSGIQSQTRLQTPRHWAEGVRPDTGSPGAQNGTAPWYRLQSFILVQSLMATVTLFIIIKGWQRLLVLWIFKFSSVVLFRFLSPPHKSFKSLLADIVLWVLNRTDTVVPYGCVSKARVLEAVCGCAGAVHLCFKECLSFIWTLPTPRHQTQWCILFHHQFSSYTFWNCVSSCLGRALAKQAVFSKTSQPLGSA